MRRDDGGRPPETPGRGVVREAHSKSASFPHLVLALFALALAGSFALKPDAISSAVLSTAVAPANTQPSLVQAQHDAIAPTRDAVAADVSQLRLAQAGEPARPRQVERARVVAYGPQGSAVVPAGEVRVRFSAAPDTASVERGFRVEPETQGSFRWTDDRTLVWRPASLRPGETYDVSVSGAMAGGGELSPLRWRFGTVDAPASTTEHPRLVLTFDDDPQSKAVGFALLDLLAQYKVRAILFPTGYWAERNPAFVSRARADGHLVCNHTYAHADLTSLGDEDMREQILRGAGAGECDLLRAPYGRLNKRVEGIAHTLGYRMYEWNIDSEDWRATSTSAIAREVLDNARPGGVALFHMHGRYTLSALPAIIYGLRASGYELSY